MQGQRGASLESTKKIHRRLILAHRTTAALLERKRSRPGYDEATCLTAECDRMEREWLSGKSPPVGTLRAVWKQVCDDYNRKHGQP
jgi:hypothetical protein